MNIIHLILHKIHKFHAFGKNPARSSMPPPAAVYPPRSVPPANPFRRSFPGLYKPLFFLYNTLVSALKETGRPGACPRSEPGAVKARRAEGLPDHSGASCAKAQALSPRYRGTKRAACFNLPLPIRVVPRPSCRPCVRRDVFLWPRSRRPRFPRHLSVQSNHDSDPGGIACTTRFPPT